MKIKTDYIYLGILAAIVAACLLYLVVVQPDSAWAAAAALIQAVAIIGLVWVTVRYTDEIKRQAEAAQESAIAARQSAEATQFMAKLQTHEARRESVDALGELESKVESIRSRLVNWKHNSASWGKLRTEAAPSRLRIKKDDVEECRRIIAGLFVNKEKQRKELAETVDAVEEFRTQVGKMRQDNRSAWPVNMTKKRFQDLLDELEESKRIVEQVRNVLLYGGT